jgi:hypothetical protein
MIRRLRLGLVGVIALAGLALGACDTGNPVTDAINREFGPIASQATAVAQCESSLNPSAISPGGGNWGLFQINVVHQSWVESMGYSWSQMLDPFVNAHIARLMYNSSGWSPWSCSSVL